jgi:flagellar FliL protein
MFGKKKKDAAAPAGADAEAPEGADGAAEGAPKKGGKKLIIIAAAAVLVLGGGGAGAFMFLGQPKAEAAGEKGEKPKKKKKAEKGEKGKGDKPEAGAPVIREGPDGEVYYTLPDLVVNIQSPEGRSTFLKLKLTLELPDHEAAEAIEPNTPRLNDMFTTFLRELRPEDLSGSQGTYQLRMEILRRVNLVAAPTEVKAVLIEEMLIQG